MQAYSKWPFFAQDEIEAVQKVLQSGRVNYWTGSEGKTFEREFAEHCNTKHAVALANGTVALELALLVIGIKEGDEVIVTPRSFFASVSAIVLAGGVPVFVDVDVNSQNIDASKIEEAITSKTRAIIAVHLAGWPCEMNEIMSIADRHQLKVIEDCAQAHGARYHNKPVGGIGHMGAFSFCQDKIMTLGGEGGMLVTNDEDLWKKAWEYKDHGKSYDAIFNDDSNEEGFRWVHHSFGTNWRITEMQSAIGRLQLKKLPEWTKKRTQNASLYKRSFENESAFRQPLAPAYITHAYYKYYVFLNLESLKGNYSKSRIISEVKENGTPCFAGSCSEIYLEGAFSEWPEVHRLEGAKKLGEESLMFLVHPTLQENEVQRFADTVLTVMKKAKR